MRNRSQVQVGIGPQQHPSLLQAISWALLLHATRQARSKQMPVHYTRSHQALSSVGAGSERSSTGLTLVLKSHSPARRGP